MEIPIDVHRIHVLVQEGVETLKLGLEPRDAVESQML